MLFCFHFVKNREHESWMTYIHSPGYFSWLGNAFELVCLLHVKQIKQTLGISGVEINEYAWRSSKSKPGAQIDLLIDRKDDVIHICEAKFTKEPFEIDAAYEKNLQNKINTFIKETVNKKAIHLTLISANGIVKNAYAEIVQNDINGEDLFL